MAHGLAHVMTHWHGVTSHVVRGVAGTTSRSPLPLAPPLPPLASNAVCRPSGMIGVPSSWDERSKRCTPWSIEGHDNLRGATEVRGLAGERASSMVSSTGTGICDTDGRRTKVSVGDDSCTGKPWISIARTEESLCCGTVAAKNGWTTALPKDLVRLASSTATSTYGPLWFMRTWKMPDLFNDSRPEALLGEDVVGASGGRVGSKSVMSWAQSLSGTACPLRCVRMRGAIQACTAGGEPIRRVFCCRT